MKNSKKASCFLSLSLLLTGIIHAQDLVPPVPIDQTGRFSPAFGGESIIKARFTVKADGTTDDIDLTEILLANPFARNMVRDSVNKWTFKPATVNDAAVDYFNMEYIVALRMDPNAPPPAFGPGRGRNRNDAENTPTPGEATDTTTPVVAATTPIPLALSPDVKTAFEEITNMLQAGDNEKALKEIRNHLRKDAHTVFDFALLNELKTSALMAQQDHYAALEASKLSTMHTLDQNDEPVYFLSDDILEVALRKRLILAATLRQSGLVASTYQELDDKFGVAADDQAHELMTIAQTALDSPEPLPLLARIQDDDWSFVPSRRTFTVSSVDGKLNKIDVHCERRNLELKFDQDVEWTLPEAFGKCELDFKGKDGTTFVVYQFSQ